MKNVKQLTECVAALKDVRRNMQDGADRRILATLDEAIAMLQCCAVEENVDDQRRGAGRHGCACSYKRYPDVFHHYRGVDEILC